MKCFVEKQNSSDPFNSNVSDSFFPMTNSWHTLDFVDAKCTPLALKGIGTVYSRAKDDYGLTRQS